MFKTKKEIEVWLAKNKISNYDILEDLSVNANGDVKLGAKKLSYLPIQFNHIEGNFELFNNDLITLKGCPIRVSGNFAISTNNLKSLENSPIYVGGDFHMGFNQVNNLNSFHTEIGKTLYCDNNPLTTLNDLSITCKKVYFYKEIDINFRLKGCEQFYDDKGFLSLGFDELQKVRLNNKLEGALDGKRTQNPKIKI